MPTLIDLTGERFERLVVLRRGENIGVEAGWIARCDCGTELLVSGWKLRSGHTKSCGCLRAEVCGDLRRQDVVDYAGAHDRVRAVRGTASDHVCVDCGGPAREWSYDRMDPNELRGRNAYGRGLAYSLSPAHYEPRCKPCHGAFDAPSRKDS